MIVLFFCGQCNTGGVSFAFDVVAVCVSELGAPRAEQAELQQQLLCASGMSPKMRISAAITLILGGGYRIS